MRAQDSKIQGSVTQQQNAKTSKSVPSAAAYPHIPRTLSLQTHCSTQVWLITNQYWPAMGRSQNTGGFLLGSNSSSVEDYKQEVYTRHITRAPQSGQLGLNTGKIQMSHISHMPKAEHGVSQKPTNEPTTGSILPDEDDKRERKGHFNAFFE